MEPNLKLAGWLNGGDGLTARSPASAVCAGGGPETPTGLTGSTEPKGAPEARPNPEPSPATPRGLEGESDVARVAFVKTRDRAEGLRQALGLLGLNSVWGKNVLLKPNFNSADSPPGSTHNGLLHALILELWEMGARTIAVADRSGMGVTQKVMEQKGIFTMARELGYEAMVLDGLGEKEWAILQPADGHWQEGFPFALPCLEAEALVQTCCLKTHQYGGHFTMSLKNSVGMVAKQVPGLGHDYMRELHSSPHQRLMIAEINAAYTPALVVLDGVEAFVTGGPASGERVWAEVVLAGTDRIAIDAIGVALLRHFGTTDVVSEGPIFHQEQIARAVELGLGVDGPDRIQIVTGDPASEAYAARIRAILMRG